GFLAEGSVLRDGGEAAQAQTVAYDEHTGKGHRGAGQHGVEHAERGDGDRGRVVGERPEQVGLDRAEGLAGQADGIDGAAEVTSHQGDVAGLDRDVGAGADRKSTRLNSSHVSSAY